MKVYHSRRDRSVGRDILLSAGNDGDLFVSSQDGRGGNSTILRLGGDGRMRGRESVVGSLRGGRYFVVILRCNFELASMSVSYKWRDKVMTGGEGCVWR